MTTQKQYLVSYDSRRKQWKVEKRSSGHLSQSWVYEDFIEYYDTKKKAIDRVEDLVEYATVYDSAKVLKKDGEFDKYIGV